MLKQKGFKIVRNTTIMSLYRDRHEKDEQEANIKENAKMTEIDPRPNSGLIDGNQKRCN